MCIITVTLKLTYFITPKLPDSDPQKKVARIRHETQIHMLNLLITSLDLRTPNLALYLLGYEVKKPVSSTNLQDPGQLIRFGGCCDFSNIWFGWKRDQMTSVLSFS